MNPNDTTVTFTGYVKVYRRLKESPVWDDPFRLKLWLYLLLTASFRPFKAWLNKEEIPVPAGSLVTSLDKLSEHSGLTKKQIRGTLAVFERAHMVALQRAHEGTIITILNWDTYQSREKSEGTTEGTTEGTPRAQDGARKGHTEGTPRAHRGHAEGTLQEGKQLKTESEENVLAPENRAPLPQTPVDIQSRRNVSDETVTGKELEQRLDNVRQLAYDFATEYRHSLFPDDGMVLQLESALHGATTEEFRDYLLAIIDEGKFRWKGYAYLRAAVDNYFGSVGRKRVVTETPRTAIQ